MAAHSNAGINCSRSNLPCGSIPTQAEKILKQLILKDLAKPTEPWWYQAHTLTAVNLVKNLLAEMELSSDSSTSDKQKLNLQLLITAAYGLNWGYVNLNLGNNQKSQVTADFVSFLKMDREPRLMHIAAVKMERLLYQRLSRFFSQAQILKVTDFLEDYGLSGGDEMLTPSQQLLEAVDVLAKMKIGLGWLDEQIEQKPEDRRAIKQQLQQLLVKANHRTYYSAVQTEFERLVDQLSEK